MLVWDVVSDGHHPRYLEAVIATAPTRYRLTLPHWTPAELVAAAGTGAEVLPPPNADEWSSFRQALTDVRPAGTLLLQAHQLVRWLAFRRAPDPGALVAFDLLVRDGVLGNPRAYRHGLTLRACAAASGTWAAREVLLRRRQTSFVSLLGWADHIGSSRLRRATIPLPDLLEKLPPAPARPKRRPVLISLVGVLKERKGLGDLVAALETLARDGRVRPADIGVAVVGACTPGYEAELDELVRRLERSGFGTDLEARTVSQQSLSGLLSATDVLVLPYRSHFGASGFLGTACEYPHLTVVCSDFGWLGHIADAAGAVLFRNGSIEDLARALEVALRERPRVSAANRIGYADAEKFGNLIWSSFPALE